MNLRAGRFPLPALLLLLAGCGPGSGPAVASGSASPFSPGLALAAVTPEPNPQIVFVPDAAGVNDFGPNALAWNALVAEARRLGLPDPAVRAVPEGRLVIGQGVSLAAAFSQAARAHPEADFELIDAALPAGAPPNLAAISFDCSEAARQAGALAASRAHTIGFVGGQESEAAHRLVADFKAGAAGAKVLVAYAGDDADQNAAKRVAQDEIARGAEVVFAASYPSGLGTIAAASQLQRLAIGFDRDEYEVAPAAVIASVSKPADEAAVQALDAYARGVFHGGARTLPAKISK